ncbi:MAG TPA: GtrA family protein [Xanthobacteraceae bacterium]|nr:GtrA family protein [Xanthobacteraceae bacterium]
MTESGSRASLFDRGQMLLRDRSFREKAIKFAIIGVVNTGVDYAIFAFAYLQLGFHAVLANTVAWLLANSGSYVLNSYITFAAESGRVLRRRDYFSFVASGVAGFVANTATVVIASYFMPVLVAKLIAIGVSFLVNFALSHFVVFPVRRK